MPPLRRRLGHDLVRAVSWHRRLVAAGLAAACVALTLHLLEPRPAATTTILAAAHDLPGGARLARSDLRTVALPRDTVPGGALRPGDLAASRVLASPVRAGEPLTDARVLGPRLVASYGPGLVAAPVRVADPAILAVVQVGDRIDVLAAHTDPEDASAPARTVVRAALVVALPGRADERSGALHGDVGGAGLGIPAEGAAGDGALVLLAVSTEVAAELARAAVTDRLSVVLRGEP